MKKFFVFRGKATGIESGVLPPLRDDDHPVEQVRVYDVPYSRNVINFAWLRRAKDANDTVALATMRARGRMHA